MKKLKLNENDIYLESIFFSSLYKIFSSSCGLLWEMKMKFVQLFIYFWTLQIAHARLEAIKKSINFFIYFNTRYIVKQITQKVIPKKSAIFNKCHLYFCPQVMVLIVEGDLKHFANLRGKIGIFFKKCDCFWSYQIK